MKSDMDVIYLAGGCFWGTQHYMSLLYGVIDTEVGYANGNVANPHTSRYIRIRQGM